MIVSPRLGQAPWDPLNMTDGEWASITGIRKPTTTTITSSTAIYENNQILSLSNTNWLGDTTVDALVSATDSYINSALGQGHGTDRFLALSHSTLNGVLTNYPAGAENGSIFGGSGMAFSYNNVYSEVDGLWPGDGLPPGSGNPSIVEYCYIHGPGTFETWYGLPLAANNIPATVIGLEGTTQSNMTDEQMESVVTITASTYYEAGAFVFTGAGIYEVSTPGTCSSGNVTQNGVTALWYEFWPGGSHGTSNTPFFLLNSSDTSQPFADGPDTLKLVYIGTYQHDDGIQMGRTEPVAIRRTKIAGFSNSCTFIQSSAAPYGSPSPWPAGPITITECDLQAAGNCWIYTDSLGVEPTWTGAMPGRWFRALDSADWSANPEPWLGRPEMITITDNLIRNRLSDNLSPNSFGSGSYQNFGGFINMTTNDPNLVKGSYSFLHDDFPVFVPDEATRQAGIVTQFNSDGTINTDILEQRFQYGIYPGCCDARTWIVLARNITEAGTEIFPTYSYRTNITINNTLAFDDRGYYLGE
jgi:hypothetical protein